MELEAGLAGHLLGERPCPRGVGGRRAPVERHGEALVLDEHPRWSGTSSGPLHPVDDCPPAFCLRAGVDHTTGSSPFQAVQPRRQEARAVPGGGSPESEVLDQKAGRAARDHGHSVIPIGQPVQAVERRRERTGRARVVDDGSERPVEVDQHATLIRLVAQLLEGGRTEVGYRHHGVASQTAPRSADRRARGVGRRRGVGGRGRGRGAGRRRALPGQIGPDDHHHVCRLGVGNR